MAFDEKFVNHIIHNYPAKKKMVALDIGANLGKYTLPMASKFRKVYAIEANPHTCDALKSNIESARINKRRLRNIEVVNCAICDVDQPVKLYTVGGDGGKGAGGNTLAWNVATLKKWGHNPNNFLAVRGLTLDTFVEEHKIKNLRFIKMDIEGAEDFAWKGAIKTLHEFQLDIVLEVHRQVNYPALFKFFQDHNFRIFDHSVREPKFFMEDSHYLITNRHNTPDGSIR